jgi:hypothetical protein
VWQGPEEERRAVRIASVVESALHQVPPADCGVVVNSASSQAFVNSGGGSLVLGNNAKIGVVGPSAGLGWVVSGGSTRLKTFESCCR